MARDPRYDILFEPVRIGPVTARNRFYQVPHCNGMGNSYPSSMAAMRGMKAEGGWAVVCTEETDFHPSGDMLPIVEGRLWDQRDIKILRRMTDAVHEHGSLAGIELSHTGHRDANLYSREVPISVSHMPVSSYYPAQARAMDRRDIRAYCGWFKDAVLRAKQAGFDIIYVYCRAGGSMPGHFVSSHLNRRTDEYGGCLENRTRLFREMLEDAIEAVGETCAIAVRYTVDEVAADGLTTEGREVIEMFAEIPDLWDVNIREWRRDSMSSRFAKEGWQEEHIAFVKSVTSKPVVGVGRFTSPDAMVSQIRRGVMDFIGAARPSIADPFLPEKIAQGQIEDIRECIGCNICVSGDFMMVPMRCTQNPTIGEEWRRSWHPERVAVKSSDDGVLVVGAGPAGLECARVLGERGYAVTLAEASEQLGGRVTAESRLPGLAEWGRVRDYRLQQLQDKPNVEIYKQSALDAGQVREFGFPRVVLATGAKWRGDGIGRQHSVPIPGIDENRIVTPDDLMHGIEPQGPVVIYDDDHYYMGGVLAEQLRVAGVEVTLITPASDVAAWAQNTLEQGLIARRLYDLGVTVIEKAAIEAIESTQVIWRHVVTGVKGALPSNCVVLVTMRLPLDSLYEELVAAPQTLADSGIKTVVRIGDCLAPSTIAAAVYSGHRYAREIDDPPADGLPFKRELTELAPL
jgi:dimethylamine/trimethylamine dehydrogenase